MEEGRETRCVTPDGVWQGPLWIRDARGRLRVYATGVDGAAHGPWWQLHPNGVPASEAWFEADELHGPYRHWDAEGRLRLEGAHDARGRMHGRWRRFGPDGGLRQEWFMEHGRPHGRTRAWHPDGGLRMQGGRERGRPHGEWRFWDSDGALRARCVYEAGRVVEGRCPAPP